MIEEVRMPKPKKEYLNNSKIANYISSNNNLLDKTLQLTTIPKKNIFVTVDLTTDENVSVINQNITQYDMAVMDSVYTLLVNGTSSFTPEMIVRIMSGNFEQDVTPQKAGAVTKSLNKLSLIRISIDCTDELRMRKQISNNKTAQLTSYLMPIREITIRSANHQTEMKGFQLIEKPVLYTYAENIKQIMSVPTTLLETKNKISNTDDVIIIKRALIKRIEIMKSNKNLINSNIINYERYDPKTGDTKGFFQTLGFYKNNYSNWKKKKSRLHNTITSILNIFIQDHYILGYTVITEGKQKINGIQIIFE